MNQNTTRIDNFAKYLAHMNPRGVRKIANRHGYDSPKSRLGHEGFILKFIGDEGDDAFFDLAEIHPDRDLILAIEDKRRTHNNFMGNNADGGSDIVKTTDQPLSSGAPSPSGGKHDTELRRNFLLLIIVAVIVIAIIRDGK